MDKFSNLHLLYQNWAHSFSYSVYNPDGELITRQIYDYTDARPRLQVDAEGNIAVTGGVRRATDKEDKEEPAPEEAKVPPGPVKP